MGKDKREAVDAAELRRCAEELLLANTKEVHPLPAEEDSRRLLHELEVQRIELEMQNDQLRKAWDIAGTALEKYTDLYDFAPVGYFTLDRDGVIHGVNLTGADLLGVERNQLIGRRFGLFVGDEARALFASFLDRIFASQDKETCEVALLDKSKQPLYVRIEAVVSTSAHECRLAVIDISERKRAEEERMIIQQSRQAALGEMLGNIAHHWRQPLNGVGLIIQELALVSEKSGLSADHLEASVDKAMRIIFSMSRTIDNFRNFFAPDKEKSLFNLNRVIAETALFVEESFKEERIEIDIKSTGDPLVVGYPHEYSQVLLNILFNARDALSEKRNDRSRVTISSFTEKGKAVVTITDNGGGIKQDAMERIFEPYFTTKDQSKGNGLGLFMAKTIIEKNMGGRLTARNVGEGAEFKIEV